MDEQNEGQIISLFPTPLYTHKLEDTEYDEMQGEIQRVVDKLYSNELWGQNPNWDSSSQQLSNKGDFATSILNDEDMKVAKSFILHHCENYMNMMQVKEGFKPVLSTSWLTLTKPGLYAHIHDHGTNSISGVYWFKTSGKDGDIVFRNANKALKSNPIGSVINEAQFVPEQGRTVMWPSHLDHGVNENKTDTDRISLSFNILLETGATN
mgnify:FL=1